MRKAFFPKMAAAFCAVLAACCMTACGQKSVSLDNESIANIAPPVEGEDIAILTLKDYGDVKIKLFPDETSKGAENFRTLIENGYYDELIFHRVVKNFVIQGGDPTGTGMGGKDCWDDASGFAQTISPNLYHFTGAVAYATAADHLNNSQFYIVTGEPITEDYFAMLAGTYGKSFSESVQKLYYSLGGTPFLDGDYEVFGQVFDGMEHCLAIQEVAVDTQDKPTSSVVIEKAVMAKYDGSGAHYVDCNGNFVNLNSESKEKPASESKTTVAPTNEESQSETTTAASKAEPAEPIAMPAAAVNISEPAEGEDIAVLTIKDYGDVKIRLFPEETSKGSENFRKLIENGYYDSLIFHRVVKNFVIQGGDPTGTGMGGKDCWDDENGFAQTISPNLYHFTGAVPYATAADHLNNSQFYIVTGEPITEDYFAMLAGNFGKSFSESVQKLYYSLGGTPFLDGDYEVFGQVFDGMEHCLAAQEAEVDGNDKPLTDIVIEKAVIVPYDGSGVHFVDSNGQTVAVTKADAES